MTESSADIDTLNDNIERYRRGSLVKPIVKHLPKTLMQALQDSDRKMSEDDREDISLSMMDRTTKTQKAKQKRDKKAYKEAVKYTQLSDTKQNTGTIANKLSTNTAPSSNVSIYHIALIVMIAILIVVVLGMGFWYKFKQ